MFTKDQTISINRYFNMINSKLLELYKQINKDEANGKIKFEKDDTKFFFKVDNGNVSFSYYWQYHDKAIKSAIFSIEKNLKQIYFGTSKMCVAFFDDAGELDELVINNSTDLTSNSSCLKHFNCCVGVWNNELQRVMNTIASISGVDSVKLDNFVIPDFVLEEKATLDEASRVKILAAALYNGGKYYLGDTHYDCANNIEFGRYIIDTGVTSENFEVKRGYITSEGDFVSADMAWYIAQKNDLINENAQSFTKNSGDFYSSCGEHFDLIEAKRLIMEKYGMRPGDAKAPQKVKRGDENNEA